MSNDDERRGSSPSSGSDWFREMRLGGSRGEWELNGVSYVSSQHQKTLGILGYNLSMQGLGMLQLTGRVWNLDPTSRKEFLTYTYIYIYMNVLILEG